MQVYLDIYSANGDELDASGFTASGGTRSTHRKFELKRFAELLEKRTSNDHM